MKLTRTVKVPLIGATKEDFLPTIQQYTKAYNLVCQDGYDANMTNGIELHKRNYYKMREEFGLPSQLAISARMKAVESLKSNKKKKRKVWNKETKQKEIHPARCPQSKLSAIRYDCNSYSLNKERNIASFLTLDGRKKYSLHIPEYYQALFADWKYSSADLVLGKTNKKVYLHIVFEKDIEDPKGNGKVIGIDRGINNIAVTSDKQFYGGRQVKFISNKYQQQRTALQKKGTQSAKRHLRKLSKKEQRFKADVNHCIAKEIVSSLSSGDIIVLENLSGIKNAKVRKAQRREHCSWSFYQLEQFLTYKAVAKGIKVVFVNPAWTSQDCSHCGKRGTRSGSQFHCDECGYSLNADLNAAKNIREKYLSSMSQKDMAAVNQPSEASEKKLPDVPSRNKPIDLSVGS